MTDADEREVQRDIETPASIQVRFGIEFVQSDPAGATAVLSMPMSKFRNPFTAAPTIGPLAILADAAGVVNHYRRRGDQWTVSSELSLEVCPGIADDLDEVVLATAHTLGSVGSTSLSVSSLTVGHTTIGVATVRSFFIPADGLLAEPRPETPIRTAQTSLSDLMAVSARSADDDVRVLDQLVDPNVNNDVGMVHGGVAAAGLELVASAAMNPERGEMPLRTASLRVNFLRPFIAGGESRYIGKPVRIGANSAVADAQARGDDGKVALTARVTAYR